MEIICGYKYLVVLVRGALALALLFFFVHICGYVGVFYCFVLHMKNSMQTQIINQVNCHLRAKIPVNSPTGKISVFAMHSRI